MTPKVSIIIPCYNVERYVRECVESVLNQSLRDIEIIIVNDGSTDGTGEILREFANKDKRIILITQENGGYGVAVNNGIAKASGEYIGIVESDDFINLTMYEKLYAKAKQSGAEVVKCNFFVYDSKSVEKNHTFNPKFQDLNLAPDGAFNPREEFQQIFFFHASVWANLYESKFIKGLKFFESTKVYQDLPFAMEVLAKAKTMAIIKEPLYHYRMEINQGNSTQFITPERLMQMVQMTDEALKVLLRYGILEQVKEYFFAHAMNPNYSFYYKTSPKIWREFCVKMREILSHYNEPQWTYFEPKIKKWAQMIMQGKVPKQSFRQYRRKLFRLRVRDGGIYLKLGDFEWKKVFVKKIKCYQK